MLPAVRYQIITHGQQAKEWDSRLPLFWKPCQHPRWSWDPSNFIIVTKAYPPMLWTNATVPREERKWVAASFPRLPSAPVTGLAGSQLCTLGSLAAGRKISNDHEQRKDAQGLTAPSPQAGLRFGFLGFISEGCSCHLCATMPAWLFYVVFFFFQSWRLKPGPHTC